MTSILVLLCANQLCHGVLKNLGLSLTQIAVSLIECRDKPIRALYHYTGPAQGRQLSNMNYDICDMITANMKFVFICNYKCLLTLFTKHNPAHTTCVLDSCQMQQKLCRDFDKKSFAANILLMVQFSCQHAKVKKLLNVLCLSIYHH